MSHAHPRERRAEQTANAEMLSDMDAELATLEQQREKTRALKQGMMQKLLTGCGRGELRRRIGCRPETRMPERQPNEPSSDGSSDPTDPDREHRWPKGTHDLLALL